MFFKFNSPAFNFAASCSSIPQGVWVDGLSEHYVTCEQDVYDLLALGEKYRQTSSTNMNAVSSRSHSLFILTLVSSEKTKKEMKILKMSGIILLKSYFFFARRCKKIQTVALKRAA